MTCWSCGAENTLETTQTCVRCGAPLIRGRGVFRRDVLLGTAGALVALWLLWIIGVILVQAVSC